MKRAGLIEVTKIVEVRGAVMKYYMSTLRAFSYDVPDLESYPKLIDDTSSRLFKVLKSVFEDKKFVIGFNEKELCNLCGGDHYKEYVALEIMNAALARTLGNKEYTELVNRNRSPNGDQSTVILSPAFLSLSCSSLTIFLGISKAALSVRTDIVRGHT